MAGARDARLSRPTDRFLQRAEAGRATHLRAAIDDLLDDPLLGKKLKGGLAGLRSLRVGSFRIVYRFDAETVEIVDINDQKDVYR